MDVPLITINPITRKDYVMTKRDRENQIKKERAAATLLLLEEAAARTLAAAHDWLTHLGSARNLAEEASELSRLQMRVAQTERAAAAAAAAKTAAARIEPKPLRRDSDYQYNGSRSDDYD